MDHHIVRDLSPLQGISGNHRVEQKMISQHHFDILLWDVFEYIHPFLNIICNFQFRTLSHRLYVLVVGIRCGLNSRENISNLRTNHSNAAIGRCIQRERDFRVEILIYEWVVLCILVIAYDSHSMPLMSPYLSDIAAKSAASFSTYQMTMENDKMKASLNEQLPVIHFERVGGVKGLVWRASSHGNLKSLIKSCF